MLPICEGYARQEREISASDEMALVTGTTVCVRVCSLQTPKAAVRPTGHFLLTGPLIHFLASLSRRLKQLGPHSEPVRFTPHH
jgi:hypothetical protein